MIQFDITNSYVGSLHHKPKPKLNDGLLNDQNWGFFHKSL
jgi:hypothetical protein